MLTDVTRPMAQADLLQTFDELLSQYEQMDLRGLPTPEWLAQVLASRLDSAFGHGPEVREHRLLAVSQLVGRVVESLNTLSREELLATGDIFGTDKFGELEDYQAHEVRTLFGVRADWGLPDL